MTTSPEVLAGPRSPVGAAEHFAYGATVFFVLCGELAMLFMSMMGVMLSDSCTTDSTKMSCGPGLFLFVGGPWVFAGLSVIGIIVGWVLLAQRRRAWAWSLLAVPTVVFVVFWFAAAWVVLSY